MNDLKLICDVSKRFTMKKPAPIHKKSTIASTIKSDKPEAKELVCGKCFLKYSIKFIINQLYHSLFLL